MFFEVKDTGNNAEVLESAIACVHARVTCNRWFHHS